MKRFKLAVYILIALPCLLGAQTLAPPMLEMVSIDLSTGNVEIHWDHPADTSGISHYNIRRASDLGGLETVDSAANTDTVHTYIHNVHRLNDRYGVVSSDTTGKSSINPRMDPIVILEAEYDSCANEISLRWNPYDTWDGMMSYYALYQSVDGLPFDSITIYHPSQNHAPAPDIEYGKTYRFHLKSVRKDGEYLAANSTIATVNTHSSKPPSYITGDYGTYHEGAVETHFTIAEDSELRHYEIHRMQAGSDFELIESYEESAEEFLFHDEVDFLDGPFIYKLIAYNYCGRAVLTSNLTSTVLLKTDSNGPDVHLSWNPYVGWDGDLAYEIYRRQGEQAYELVGSTPTQDYYETLDPESGEDESSSFYYQVRVKNPLSPEYVSISNEVEIEIESNLRFEYDAFIPGGSENAEFGPTFDFLPKNYQFRIFNRLGIIVFETSDPHETWDGRIGSSLAPEGGYMYTVKYSNSMDQEKTIRGSLSVVYP